MRSDTSSMDATASVIVSAGPSTDITLSICQHALADLMPKHDLSGYLAERDDFLYRAACNRFLRHAEDDAAFFVLRTRGGAKLAHFQQPSCAVVTHPGHDDSERVSSGVLSGRAEQHVRRRPMPRHRWAVLDGDMIAQPCPLQQHMPGTGCDIGATGLHGFAVFRFLHLDLANTVETLGEGGGESLRHV